ncbi:MAG: SDR family oxidoreductase [Ilumatobacteraceae bacterium]|nr:SDR family oxidoreductase [Ilumatobacteraceae bacterium]MBP7889397.1 SDR family oxidoreductase [Ilumatobacteraceae bacterium]MBP8209307.1 SDR family oxidoreductase [Ilumatobacteraceae bacterium]
MVTPRDAPAAGRLAGRRVVVTGAARGIGAAIAQAFAGEGARLALMDREGDRCRATAAQLGALALDVDLADPTSACDAMQAAVDGLGGIDILVNNAGILHMAPLLEITVDDWDRTFDVNVRAMLLTTQVAARAMISAGQGGVVINMASMGGKLGSPNQAHYAASKAAVISLTRVSALELGEHGIRVNCICPGYVLTEMGAATRTPEMVAKWSSMSPLGRCAEPQEVADMAVFLASDQARYCTGQAMNVSGGMVMH